MSTSEDDEQFDQAFGEHTGISIRRRDDINDIRQNETREFSMYFNQDGFTDLSWRLLGRYIANSTYLEKLAIGDCSVTDENMALLFGGLLVESTSLTNLWLADNEFGINGVQCMVTFLQNSPNLSNISFDRNNNINTDCFELVVQILHGRSLDGRNLEFKLSFSKCGITNISALDRYALPNIQDLELSGNNIGREGCITISNLLQQEGSNLKYLDLSDTGMGDGEAELLATSLENNTKLRTFLLEENDNISERGFKAFLKLIFDVSSIENMHNSNHTLRALYLPECSYGQECNHITDSIFKINSNPGFAAVREKVIKCQLNSTTRKELCRLQGIEYCSIGTLFADIEPVFLPEVLSLIGSRHGQSEFYTALIPMVPDLMSSVDTSGMMKDEMVKNEAHAKDLAVQIAELTRQLEALSTKNDQLSRRLAAREESGDSRQSTIEEGIGETAAESVKKRQKK